MCSSLRAHVSRCVCASLQSTCGGRQGRQSPNDNNMDNSKIMYVAVTGDTMYAVNTVSRQTQYKSGLDYDIEQ